MIWSSHAGGYKSVLFMKCDAVLYGRTLLRFQRNVNDLFSESKIKPREQSTSSKQSTWYMKT
jgi:hypothetical protein